MSDTAVCRLDAGKIDAWNGFVERHPEGTFFHQTDWTTLLEDAYGFETHYIYGQREGRLCGVLPLALVDRPIIGRALISTPFCVVGGALADDDGVACRREDAAADIADERGVDYIELRNHARRRPDWTTRCGYYSFRRAISSDPEANLKAIPKRQRAVVRKGLAAGLETGIDRDTERFYRLYAEGARNHGTPAYPRRHFSTLQRAFGERCEVRIVEKDGAAVCGMMTFYFRDEVLPYYVGARAGARRLEAQADLYWEVIRRPRERGCRVFDYGRSYQGTGAFAFKKNWGFAPSALNYQCRAVGARDLPDINPLNPKYRLAIALWKRLPLPLANRLGAWLSPGLC